MPRGCCVVCICSFLLKIFELLTVLVGRTMVPSVHTSYSRKLWLSYLTCSRTSQMRIKIPAWRWGGQASAGASLVTDIRGVEGRSCCGRERCVHRSRAGQCSLVKVTFPSFIGV